MRDRVYSHVRVTIYPDGGIKRVRIIGKRSTPDDEVLTVEVDGLHPPQAIEPSESSASGGGQPAVEDSFADAVEDIERGQRVRISDVHGTVTPVTTAHTPAPSSPIELANPRGPIVSALPLTPEAFAPFGHVVQAFGDIHSVPRGKKVTAANQGSATKFHKLAPILSSYPSELAARAIPALSVYRCKPLDFDFVRDVKEKGVGWEVKLLERHPYTNQAFVPLGVGSGKDLKGDDALENPGRAYLVVVAKNGQDDKPDLNSLRAFVAGAGQADVYATGIWRERSLLFDSLMIIDPILLCLDHPMVALETVSYDQCRSTSLLFIDHSL